MPARLLSHLTYANVMATIAVFLALGGGLAWALANNSVKSKHIKDGQVKDDDLNVLSVLDSFVGQYQAERTGLVKLDAPATSGDPAETQVLVSVDDGGLSLDAECSRLGNGDTRARLLAFTGTSSARAAHDGDAPFALNSGTPPDDRVLGEVSGAGVATLRTDFNMFTVASSQDAVQLDGTATASINLAGSDDCFFTASSLDYAVNEAVG